MEHRLSFGDMQVNLSASGSKGMGKPKPESPFRILILGDFSGRAHRGIQEPITPGRKPIAVDIDNFETVLGKLSPKVELVVGDGDDQGGSGGAGGSGVSGGSGVLPISFSELEDFHPDQIYERVALFQALRKTRGQLLNPATFKAAAAEVASWSGGGGGGGDASSASDGGDTKKKWPVAADPEGETDGDLFKRLLGRPGNPQVRGAQTRAEMTVEALLRQAIGPSIVMGPDPRQDELVAAVDGATTRQMQRILHAPEFQAMEAAWRGLDFLIRNLETDELLRVSILDVSKEELARDLTATENLKSTGLYSLLVEQTIHTPGGQPWAAVMGLYTFDATAEDAQILGRVAKVVRETSTAFVAGGGAGLLGCPSFATVPSPREWTQKMDPQSQAAWDALRELYESAYVGLVAPRFLLRLPYGKETEPIDRFDFQELDPDGLSSPGQHERYLWGNGAWVAVLLLGQVFGNDGWDMSPGGGATVEGIAAHTFKKDGESAMKPCAEAWLTDTAADVMMEKGVMALMSIKGRDAVRLWRFQSLAKPPKNLSGRWS